MVKYGWLLFFSLTHILGLAQENHWQLGFTLGTGFSNVRQHTVLKDRYEGKLSSSFSIYTRYLINPNWSVRLGMTVEQRGGEFTSFERLIIGVEPPLQLGDTVTRSNHNQFAYFSFPLTVAYHIPLTERLQIGLSFGGAYARLINQAWDFERLDDFAINEPGTLQFDYRQNDFGLLGGVDLYYRLSSTTFLNAALTYQRSLTNMFTGQDAATEAFHQRIFLELGVQFMVKGRR